MTKLQAVILSWLFAIGTLVLVVSELDYLINTIVLLVAISIGGVWLCNRTAHRLGDRRLMIMGSLWLIKLVATFLLLYIGWMPQLDPADSSAWGYDPQRYYQYSWDLVNQDWSEINISQNYMGVLYYYGAIFSLLGRNPFIPALFNSLVTLGGTLFLIQSAYRFTPDRTPVDWRIAYILLIPEVLWYDVMTSRETLMAVLIIVSILAAGRYLLESNRSSLKASGILVAGSLASIVLVRAPMILPVSAAIVTIAVLARSTGLKKMLVNSLTIVLIVLAACIAPMIQQMIGGYDVNYLALLDSAQGGNDLHTDEGWSERSIGRLLVPTNTLQSMIFLPARMVAYLVAPLPNIDVNPSELISGSWSAWQHLISVTTASMIILAFPYVLGGTVLAWQRRVIPSILIIPIAFWLNFAAVAGGNSIIHERYRLMFTLLLFATAWIGYTRSSRVMVGYFGWAWFGLLGTGALLYTVYKLS